MFTYPVVEFADPNINNPNNPNNDIDNDIKYIETSIDETHNYINKIKDNFKKILTFRDNKYKNILNELEVLKSENKLLTKEKSTSYIECMTLKNALDDAKSNKTFEEHNYNNVSMLKNLSNQILEKDNEIRVLKAFKELTNNKLKNAEPVKVIEPEPVKVIEPEPIKVIKAKAPRKTKDTTKQDMKTDEIIIETNIPDTKSILKPKRVAKPKTKKTEVVIAPDLTPILPLPLHLQLPIENTNTIEPIEPIKPVKLVKPKPVKKEKLKTVKHTIDEPEPVIDVIDVIDVIEVNEVIEVIEVIDVIDVIDVINVDPVIEVIDVINVDPVIDVIDVIDVINVDPVIDVIDVINVDPVIEVNAVIDVAPVNKVIIKKAITFPSTQPVINNLEVITIETIDYYLDNTTNNVYQLVNGDDVGAFLGVYNPILNCIEQL